jgi:hypothetical protein
MRRRRREAGEGQLGCMVGVIFFLLAVFLAFKLIPVKVKAADLRQTVIDESKSAGTHTDEVIRKAILTKAESLGLPVTDENIEIARGAVAGSASSLGSNNITVDVDYIVPVQFPGKVYKWHFHHHAENPIF